jgi:hypothetical protein
MRDNCSKESSSVQIVMREGIGLLVKTKIIWLLYLHEIYGIGGETDENYFHDKHV